MGHIRTASILLLSVISVVTSSPWLGAWGRSGHFWISERALDALHPDLRQVLGRHRSELVRLSVAADDRRTDDPQEGHRHYLDLDNYGRFPFPGFSTERQPLEQTWGADWVRSQGTVLWTIQKRYSELVEAFRSRKIGAIRLAAGDLSHYVADLHQPFHASANHDGQLSGQHGVHARFESDLVELMLPDLTFRPAPLRRYDRLAKAMYEVALESLQWVDNVLTADQKIVVELSIQRAQFRDLPREQRRFPDRYYTRMREEVGFIVGRRMNEAAIVVASLWQQAWEEAQKPTF